MTILGDHIDERSEVFQVVHLAALLADDRQLALVNNGGGDKYVARSGASCCAGSALQLLVDRDAPLLELSPLAAPGSDFPVGAGVFTGIGVVADVECVIIANDPTVRWRHEHHLDQEGAAATWNIVLETGCRCCTSSSRAAPTCRTRARSSSPAARRSAT